MEATWPVEPSTVENSKHGHLWPPWKPLSSFLLATSTLALPLSATERCSVQACFIAPTYWTLPSGLQTSSMLEFPGITGGPVVTSPCPPTLSSTLSQEFLIPGDWVSTTWWQYVDGNKWHRMENERLPVSRSYSLAPLCLLHIVCTVIPCLPSSKSSQVTMTSLSHFCAKSLASKHGLSVWVQHSQAAFNVLDKYRIIKIE